MLMPQDSKRNRHDADSRSRCTNGGDARVSGVQLRVVVADDEPVARQGLADIVRAHPELELVGEATGGRDAIERIARTHPDIVVLDVEMPNVDGFDVATSLSRADQPELIFVTAHEDFALRGYQADAVDYVLKPYSAERLNEALSRAIRRRRDRVDAARFTKIAEVVGASAASTPAAGPRYSERLLVTVGTRSIPVPTSSISLLHADGACVTIRTSTGSYTLRESLQEIERHLDPRYFLRVHRSAIVRLDAIRAVERANADQIVLVVDAGTKVPVSRSRRSAVLDALADVRG